MASKAMKRRPLAYVLFALPLLVIGSALLLLGPWLYERDLDCSGAQTARAAAICRSLAEHMEFGCCGHAIISPGYRVTALTEAKAWCETGITQDDAATLKALADSADWRLSSGAEGLYRMATGRAADNSIENPSHPDYILKPGCEAILSR